MNRSEIMRQLTGGNVAVAPKAQPYTASPRLEHKEEVKKATLPTRDEQDLAPVPLGYNQGCYYYLNREEGQIREIPMAGHSSTSLMGLARLSFWQQRFKGPKGPDWIAAIDFMVASCRKIGVFSPEIVRGRGVSYDNGRSVLHLGDKLLVDGIPQPSLTIEKSSYIYERSGALKINLGKPLSTDETYKLLDIANMFSWQAPDMGLLLAGWIVSAPICGALPWRTHLWLTGQTGAGKSYIVSNFVNPLVGPLAIPVQSKTTEAGIRQHLKLDARPIIFDEPETQNERDRDRVQQVLDLARQASSEDGFDILKGTATGKEVRFRIRSSFLFSSINFGAVQAADENRIVPVTLVRMDDKIEGAQNFDRIKEMIRDHITDDFADRLLSRTLMLLPVIRANVKTFSRALSEKVSSRQADTIGCLVACVYSLQSENKITLEEAEKFIADKSWVTMATNRTETDSDHEKALSFLLEQVIRATPSCEWSIAEAIKMVADDPYHDAAKVLGRNGIRVKEGNVYLARSHYIIDKFYQNTAWARVWDKTLLQMREAYPGQTTMDFAGAKKRPVVIPLERILG